MDIKLLKDYQKLIYKIASKFKYDNKEDMVQAGYLGLIKAYKNYNKNSEAKFSTYAYQYIFGEMYEASSKSKNIFLNKNTIRIYKNVEKAKELLTQKYKREVSYKEVAEYLNLDINDIICIMNSIKCSISLDDKELNISRKEHIEDLILLKEALSELNKVEKEVIKSRYLEDNTQEETAKILGLTQVKVSRIEKGSKRKLREFINN